MGAVERIIVHDEAGREWTVFERGAGGEQFLFFDSCDAFRRVREFPSHWRNLTVAELLDLSWRR